MSRAALLLVLGWLGSASALAQEAAPDTVDDATVPTEEPGADAGVTESPASVPDGSDPPPAADGKPSAAPTDPSLQELQDRLLGDVPLSTGSPTERKVEAMDLPDTPGWLWPVGLTVLALLAGLRWQLNRTPEAPARLRVTQRVMLGRDGNLAVVEVGEGSDKRRLLVGYGGGAPRLVAELDVPDATPAREARDTGTAARRWQQALERATGRAGRPASPSGVTSSGTSDASRKALRPRASLIAEVLAERDTAEVAPAAPEHSERMAARPPVRDTPASDVVSEDDTGDDGSPSETYTFRGLIG